MPLVATRGAASAQGFGEFAQSAAPVYIEDVMSVYLYTGNGSTQTITNGIDMSTYGGLVWVKSRAVNNNCLVDTVRGASNTLQSDLTSANVVASTVTAFSSSGFTVGTSGLVSNSNGYVSWTFRKQPKFFDVVTYTGDGNSSQTISHNLGSVPGCMFVKCSSSTGSWFVYHRSLGNTGDIFLNTTAAARTGVVTWNSSTPTSTQFQITSAAGLNTNGVTYVAYLFADNAGGFGLTGTDNVISCGSFTTDASGNATVSLGYEPQWILIKETNATGNWRIADTMRGFSLTSTLELRPNQSSAEATFGNATFQFYPNATGFTAAGGVLGPSLTYIYIAIRRGPMKTPTSGTSVYNATTWTGNNTTGRTLATGLSSPPDLAITQWRNGLQANLWWDMLRGFSTTAGDNSIYLRSPTTDAESPLANYFYRPDMVNVGFGSVASSGLQLNGSSSTLVGWFLRRAPGFFDEVCYTGNSPSPAGYSQTLTHNLGVPPELTIVKWRSGATGESWAVMCTSASSSPDRRLLFLDSTAAGGGLNSYFSDASGTPVLPTATQFTVGSNAATNKSTATYVAYLFASVAGVSKVGSYSGTGATQTIDCGFTGGARFVLIKRTDSTGDWYVWDTARGMVSGTDPSLLLNSTAAEVNANSVYTTSVGFQIVSTAAGINASGGSYLFWAVA